MKSVLYKICRTTAVTVMVLLNIAQPAMSAPGDLDATFDTDGIVVTRPGPIDDRANAVVIQEDGKIVVAGTSEASTSSSPSSCVLMRYNSDGSMDTGFGAGGIVATTIGDRKCEVTELLVQPDGKLVMVGYSLNGNIYEWVLARYHLNGSLDSSFDGDGIVTTSIGLTNDQAFALAIQPDDKLLVGGFSFDNITYIVKYVVARYNPDGSLDSSFGTDGVTARVLGSEAHVKAMVVQPDGKIVAAGISSTISGFEYALVRYNSDGSLDTSFDSDGIVTTAISSNDSAAALGLQSDGKLVVAGASRILGNRASFALVRYNADGSLDTSFDSDGIVTTAIGSGSAAAYSLVVLPNGKLLASGSVTNGGFMDSDIAVVRYNTDGSLDSSFNGDGIVTTPIDIHYDTLNALAVEPGGGIVAAGNNTYNGGSKRAFLLVRYEGDATDITPDNYSFPDVADVSRASVETTANETISGLGAGVAVPIRIAGGEYSLNGAPYTTEPGWAKNGDQISVRHTASNNYGTSIDTELRVGGLSAPNNSQVVLGVIAADVFTSVTEVEDTLPDSIIFVVQGNAPLAALLESNSITVSGINSPAAISINGGEYSVNGGTYTAAASAVNNGDTVRLRHTSSPDFSTGVNTTVTIGGVTGVFTSTTLAAPDTMPNAFTIIDKVDGDVLLNTLVVSEAVTVTGIGIPAAISITGGEYSINGAAFTSVAGMVNNGDAVRVRHASSDSYSTDVDTVLTIGGVSDTFTSTTRAMPDLMPDAYVISSQISSAVPLNTVIISDPITVTGISEPTSISISGGEYSVNGGSYTSASGTVSDGDTVLVRHTSSTDNSTTTTTILSIGIMSEAFTSTTEDAPSVASSGVSGSGGGGGCVLTRSQSHGADPTFPILVFVAMLCLLRRRHTVDGHGVFS